MKKWVLLFSILFSVLAATAYDDFHSEFNPENEGNYSYEEFFAPNDGPLPLPDDPSDPPPSEQPPPPSPPGSGVPYTMGSGQTSRFGSQSFSFYPRGDVPKTIKLRISALRNNITVNSVYIRYADNGETREVREFRGELSTGRAREIKMTGRPLYRVDVDVSAGYFWKQPGSFRLDATGVP